MRMEIPEIGSSNTEILIWVEDIKDRIYKIQSNIKIEGWEDFYHDNNRKSLLLLLFCIQQRLLDPKFQEEMEKWLNCSLQTFYMKCLRDFAKERISTTGDRFIYLNSGKLLNTPGYPGKWKFFLKFCRDGIWNIFPNEKNSEYLIYCKGEIIRI